MHDDTISDEADFILLVGGRMSYADCLRAVRAWCRTTNRWTSSVKAPSDEPAAFANESKAQLIISDVFMNCRSIPFERRYTGEL